MELTSWEMDTGARMKCISDYYIELSLGVRSRVSRLHQEAALGEWDESPKQISVFRKQRNKEVHFLLLFAGLVYNPVSSIWRIMW